MKDKTNKTRKGGNWRLIAT